MTPSALLTGFAGAALVAAILWDAFETILVPRRNGRRFRLTRYFYVVTWSAWRAVAVRIARLPRREAFLGFYGPISQILLLACWAAGLIVAFAMLQSAASAVAPPAGRHFETLLYLSGETFFTLGFGDVTPATVAGRWLSVLEAGMGFGFLGTVIGYLPTMYAAFSQREIEITLLDAHAGSPPTAAEFLGRLPAGSPAGAADEVLRAWERWAAHVLESHISYTQLSFYRSQHLNQSWLGALTAILDSSALIVAGLESVPDRQAKLTFAMARHALVDITQIYVARPGTRDVDRLPAEALARLRARLAEGPAHLPEDAAFEERLRALRRTYEPYAQAFADLLLLELPPWIHAAPRRDNWQGGPWDRALAQRAVHEHRPDEHF